VYHISTEVLVIGSGGAGLLAAIAAREAGREVLVVSKAPLGLASCTIMSNGGFRSAVGGFSQEDHVRVTMQNGLGLNEPSMVKVLAEESADAIRGLTRFGVPVKERKSGFYCHGDDLQLEGASITRPLAGHVKAMGIQAITKAVVWDFLMHDGQVFGAWGYDQIKKDFFSVTAGSMVLAAGGAGGVYSRTDNPNRITGDGYAAALRAGLELADMEFVQFYPVANADPKAPNLFIPPVAADVGLILNKDGENIVEKYGITKRPLAVQSRDSLSRAMCLEVMAGRGVNGGVMLDFTRADEEAWLQGERLFGEARVSKVRDFLERSYHVSQRPMTVLPTCHFFMGGIAADSGAHTRLPGLFAAGEVVVGLHGANRLGGNALSETVVFGARAGKAAARWARGKIPAEEVRAQAEKGAGALAAALAGNGTAGEALNSVKKLLQNLMWEKVGVIRTGEGLIRAAAEVAELTPAPRVADPDNPGQWVVALELKNMLLVAGAVIAVATARVESRGSHYRHDYPQQSTEWEVHQTVRLAGGGWAVDRVAVGELSRPQSWDS